MGNMCMRLRNAGKGEASPSLFPRFALFGVLNLDHIRPFYQTKSAFQKDINKTSDTVVFVH
jgi:hypothetical protein